MNTWLDHWDRRYTERVRLLVEILPVLAQEPRFALKGGTAINLFEHDLPRLSVDIDLALAPAYDVLPTNSGQGYQEFICGADGRDSTLDNAMSQCEAFGLQPVEAAAEVSRVIAVVDTWREHFAQAGVSARDVESLAERIDGAELLAQRTGFDPTGFQAVPARKPRRSPFRRV